MTKSHSTSVRNGRAVSGCACSGHGQASHINHLENTTLRNAGRKICLVFALLVLATAGHAQLLWKISGNGLTRPSYVIGTNHLAPITFVDSIAGVDAAIDAVDQVYGELDLKEMSDPAKVLAMQQSMLLPDGQTIDKLLTPEQLECLNAFMTELMGRNLSDPMIASMLGKFQPSALETQFTLMLYVKNHPGFNPQQPFDLYFQQQAVEKGKEVGGLETMEFQIQMLFNSVPLERQVTRLMCLIDNKDYQETVLARTAEAFFRQDLEAINKVMCEKLDNECDSTPEEEAALVQNRNADWANRLPAIMKEKATFLAVGAGHLPGEDGLLNLLRKAGFEVTPVSK